MTPNKTQITQAHTLVDNGLDLLIGSHAHIPGEVEVYSGKYIFYSLGNAIFDQDRGMNAGNPTGMDTIYDEVLGKNAVPTYITIFPELLIKKICNNVYTTKNAICNDSKVTIGLKEVHGARIEKGVYTGLDDQTLSNLLEKIISKE